MFEGKTVLVTGGTGSIGSGIVLEVLARGCEKVIVFSRDEIKHFMLKKRIPDPRLSTIVGDVRDLSSLEQAFRNRIDIIYHAAAMKHVVMCEEFPNEAVKTNILGTQNTVNLALKHNVPKMITISTDKAACPTNLMGATKFIAERLTLNANSLSNSSQVFACVRFGNVANSRGSVIPVYVDNLIHGNPLEITSSDVTRFIMEISDAVSLIIKATEYATGGEIFIFKMRSFGLADLLDVMVNKIAPRLNIDPSSVRIERSSLFLGEKLHEDLVNSTELSQVQSIDDMYVIKTNQNSGTKPKSTSTEHIVRYSSYDLPRISKEAIEKIVVKYLIEKDILKNV